MVDMNQTTTSRFSQSTRPRDRTIRLEHGMAQSFFLDEQNQVVRRRFDDMKYEEDHNYPFAGTKHLDLIGINVDPV